MRCASPIYYVGGGSISVSRALKKLGGESLCMYLAVGSTVAYLQQLVSEEGIEQMEFRLKVGHVKTYL
ncbi:MAG: hypothetical protein KAJ23_18545 [Maribacter sp.]|nr:hypothetical protein [Maribacter sp.]